MMAIILASLLAAGVQDGDVDRILLRFQQRREKVRSEAEYRRLLSDARLELEQFLKDYPRHPDAARASYQIAETYLSARDFDRGVDRLEAYLRDYPSGGDAAAARFALAEIALEREKDAEARAGFDDFVKHHPTDERVLYARLYTAVTYQNEGRYDDAIATLRAAREEFKGRKESWGALMQMAVVYHVQEKNAEARKTLEEIIRDCPDRDPVEVARRHLAEYLKIGRDAPGFAEKDADGRELSNDRLKGKVVVVYFFDPVAPTSQQEAQFLRRAREDAAAAGSAADLDIVGVSIGADRKEVAMYKAQVKADWTLLFDGKGIDGRIARAFDVRGLPALSLIDRKGKLRFYNIAGRDFRNSVAKLLQEK